MLLLSGSMAHQCVMLVILCGVHFRAFRHATARANGAFRPAVAEIWHSRDCATLRRYETTVVLRVLGDGDVLRGAENVSRGAECLRVRRRHMLGRGLRQWHQDLLTCE